MDLEKYHCISNATFASFEFSSDGPNGLIKKVINYTKFDEMPDGTPVFNLGFGDWNEMEQKVDDLTISNNLDKDKVLATVAGTVIEFTDRYGKLPIFAKGSTPVRTRLYQMGINANYLAVAQIFEVFGLINAVGWVKFEKNKNFDAFLVIRK